MRKLFLADPGTSNAGPTVSSLITRSRFTTHPKIVPVVAGISQSPRAFHLNRDHSSVSHAFANSGLRIYSAIFWRDPAKQLGTGGERASVATPSGAGVKI
jgi:hypothetical protein